MKLSYGNRENKGSTQPFGIPERKRIKINGESAEIDQLEWPRGNPMREKELKCLKKYFRDETLRPRKTIEKH